MRIYYILGFIISLRICHILGLSYLRVYHILPSTVCERQTAVTAYVSRQQLLLFYPAVYIKGRQQQQFTPVSAVFPCCLVAANKSNHPPRVMSNVHYPYPPLPHHTSPPPPPPPYPDSQIERQEIVSPSETWVMFSSLADLRRLMKRVGYKLSFLKVIQSLMADSHSVEVKVILSLMTESFLEGQSVFKTWCLPLSTLQD